MRDGGGRMECGGNEMESGDGGMECHIGKTGRCMDKTEYWVALLRLYIDGMEDGGIKAWNYIRLFEYSTVKMKNYIAISEYTGDKM